MEPYGQQQPQEQEEIPPGTWEAWNRVLTPSAQQHLRSARGAQGIRTSSLKPEDQLVSLHALALELRDRLRFSQRRNEELKAEAGAAHNEVLAERQRTAARLIAFEAEIDRLKDRATQQASSIDTHNQLTLQLQTDLAQAQSEAKLAKAEVQQVKRQSQTDVQAAKAETEACKRHSQAEIQAGIRAGLADADTSRLQLQSQVKADIDAARAQAEEYRSQLDNYRQELQAQAQKDIQAATSAVEEANLRAAEAEARAADAEAQRASVLEELENIASQVDDVAARAGNQGNVQTELMNALVASKARLSEMHALEGLYSEARDELSRLDKENMELKDMWQQGVSELGQSRILDALPNKSHKLAPSNLLPAYTGIRKGGKGKKKNGWIEDCVCDGGMMPVGRCSPTRPLPGGAPGSLPSMSYLGPSSRMYPPDPDSYVYLRVGGGYDPKHVGKEELPKASGWVPHDVVKVVQAFRHAYKLHSPDWVFWEPLLLLIDEVYRAHQHQQSQIEASRAASRVNRQAMAPHVQLPNVVQNSRIMGLKRQLENMRRNLGMTERRDTNTLKKIAEKEYHLTNQLDQAVEQNLQLRRSLAGLSGGTDM